MKTSNPAGARFISMRLPLYIFVWMAVSGELTSAFTMPAWTDIFSSLKPYKDIGSNVNNIRWEETADKDGEFDELRLIEEGEPRYGLVQLGSGQNYNVTLNLSGIILLGLGLSTGLLAYMFLNAFKDDGGSSTSYDHDSYESPATGYGHRKGYLGRKGYRNKRSLDDDEKETIQMLYRIISSLSEDQVEDILTQFEKELLKQANDREQDIVALDDDCIKKFVCQLLVANLTVPKAADGLRELRLIHLLQEAARLPNTAYDNDKRININEMNPFYGQNAAPHKLYSIYEWSDLISLVLGQRIDKYFEDTNVPQKIVHQPIKENNKVKQHFQGVKDKITKMSSKISKYFEVHSFASSIQANYNSTPQRTLQDNCMYRYSSCELGILQRP